jgi:hypothetical protein
MNFILDLLKTSLATHMISKQILTNLTILRVIVQNDLIISFILLSYKTTIFLFICKFMIVAFSQLNVCSY